ncbi:MAG: Gfo/Idh/MocA family oxidoreductase [Chloroflexi bacterium]|nr:Gfo/Idh/MocA family oxidoreductase [Chloroflexota bacterium]
MRIAIVGAGRRGIAHGRAAVRYSGAQVVAVCDPDSARAEQLAAELGAQPYRDHRQALDAERLDVMYLTSPPPTHTEQALDGLAAGCALMIEKPVALDMAGVARIGRAAEEAGKLVLVCQQHRYTPAADRARELLAGRRVGLVHSYLYRQKPDIRGNWRRSWGGGHIVENQIHPIDLCRYLLGEVTTVFAQYADHVLAGTEDWDNWDSYSVTLRFANGAVGSIGTTYAAFPRIPQSSALDVVADGVVLRYHWGRLEAFYPDGRTESVTVRQEPTVAIGHEFLRAVETGNRSRLRQDYADANRSLEVCLAANESAETGKVIHL